ncbi:MAG: FlgD immunoglobulin-like domain containing protein [bacterium]|nr:FlgD immunoglobulin-like domain containing protein [bacterium]
MKYILLSLLFASSGFGEYVMTKSIIAGGGGTSASTNYILKDAIGQSVIGQSVSLDSSDHIEQAGFYTLVGEHMISVQNDSSKPKVFSLSRPFPNPNTRGDVNISYSVPKTSQVNIKVYNITGGLVKTLVAGEQLPGYYSLKWRGNSERGAKVSNGIYFIRMVSSEFKSTKKLILVK